MPKRITLLLDDDVYAYLLSRAGSERKISQALNPVVRAVIAEPDITARARDRQKLAELEAELVRLKERLK